MAEPLIRFQSVRKAFGHKVVCADLSLDIYKGEALTIVGGSGVGKSVTLKMLIGLLKQDSGSVTVDGVEVSTMKEGELSLLRQRIAMLFQAGALFDSLSVEENVAYGLLEHFRDRMTKLEIKKRVAWALDLVGLPGIEAMHPADLSGGMRKRVALARSIAVQPEVVLYDEPTTGLDPINTDRVNHLIMGLKQRLNITSVVVTHDMKSAFTISDRVAMVYGGRVICIGTVEEFRNAPDERVRNFVEGRAPAREDVATLLSA
jgi:phospholipid/cholesterol/gamma-HCH transport system ATP-binding protein